MTIGIDWSGAADKSSQRRAIWLAEVRDGRLRRIRHGWTRAEVVTELTRLREELPNAKFVVGLDFGFSFPVAALEMLNFEEPPPRGLWELAARHLGPAAEAPWLAGAAVTEHFAPRTLAREPHGLRATEQELASRYQGLRPRSTIDLRAVTGNVGRQSVRGFEALRELGRSGFAIWPFDPPYEGRPVVVEVYPRLLRRWVVDGHDGDPTREEVRRALRKNDAVPVWASELANDENAMDATITALVLDAHAREVDFTNWSSADPSVSDREGHIWLPPSDQP